MQKILSERTKEQPRITICSPHDLPLRGLLKCPKCTRSLTGSASKGKTKYSLYYHCRSSCGVRFRAEEVNNSFRDYLTMYIPRNPEELINEIVGEHKNQAQIIKNERNVILAKIRECNHRLERARELMLDNELEPSEYRQIKEEAATKINLLESELSPMEPGKNRPSDISLIVRMAIKNLSEIDKIYDGGSLETKKLVVSTLFPQKLDYNSGIGRTQKSNSFAEFIFLKNSELRAKKRDKTI